MEGTEFSISKAGRHNLKAICREFERCSRHYPPLYHQRMVPWSEKGRVGITLPQWEAFQRAESERLDSDPWWQWDESKSHDEYLGQWFGEPDGTEEFAGLSESVATVLSRESFDIDPLDFNIVVHSGSDWLSLLHNFRYQMPLLRSDMSLWGVEDYELEEFYVLAEQWETLDDGISVPRHPVVWRLIDNVFSSSMAAIRAILSPDTVITTNEPWPLIHGGLSSTVLPATSAPVETSEDIRPSDIAHHQLIEEELFWSIKCAETGHRFRFIPKAGFKYLGMLLRSPNRRFTPIEAYGTQGTKPQSLGAAATRHGEEQRHEAASLLPNSNALSGNLELIDSEADRALRAEYQRLLEEYERCNHPDHEDAEEAKELEREIAEFKKRFVYDHDEHGNIRSFPKPDWERARKAVTNALNRSLNEIRGKSQELADQLDSQLDRTRGFCFRPSRKLPQWEVVTRHSDR